MRSLRRGSSFSGERDKGRGEGSKGVGREWRRERIGLSVYVVRVWSRAGSTTMGACRGGCGCDRGRCLSVDEKVKNVGVVVAEDDIIQGARRRAAARPYVLYYLVFPHLSHIHDHSSLFMHLHVPSLLFLSIFLLHILSLSSFLSIFIYDDLLHLTLSMLIIRLAPRRLHVHITIYFLLTFVFSRRRLFFYCITSSERRRLPLDPLSYSLVVRHCPVRGLRPEGWVCHHDDLYDAYAFMILDTVRSVSVIVPTYTMQSESVNTHWTLSNHEIFVGSGIFRLQ